MRREIYWAIFKLDLYYKRGKLNRNGYYEIETAICFVHSYSFSNTNWYQGRVEKTHFKFRLLNSLVLWIFQKYHKNKIKIFFGNWFFRDFALYQINSSVNGKREEAISLDLLFRLEILTQIFQDNSDDQNNCGKICVFILEFPTTRVVVVVLLCLLCFLSILLRMYYTAAALGNSKTITFIRHNSYRECFKNDLDYPHFHENPNYPGNLCQNSSSDVYGLSLNVSLI